MKIIKHRAEVIEVYPNEGKAAVRFSHRNHERVECVNLRIGPDCRELTVGMRGWVTYHTTPNCGLWGFEPFKESTAMSKEQAVETAMQLREFFKVYKGA